MGEQTNMDSYIGRISRLTNPISAAIEDLANHERVIADLPSVFDFLVNLKAQIDEVVLDLLQARERLDDEQFMLEFFSPIEPQGKRKGRRS